MTRSKRLSTIGLAIVISLVAGLVLWWTDDAPPTQQPATQKSVEEGDNQPVVTGGTTDTSKVAPQGLAQLTSRPKLPSHPKISAPVLRTLENLKTQGVTPATAKQQGFQGITTPLVRVDTDARLQVYITTTALDDGVYDALRSESVEIEITDDELSIIQGWIPVDRVEAVSELSFVSKIELPGYGQTHAGSVLTEGDGILLANLARQLSVDGTGVKVGVISDGVNDAAVAAATGDLPPSATVYGSCTRQPNITCNEGTAMLEIIHDLAPGAQLAFASGLTTLEFGLSVLDLVFDFGADIVVDDIGFFTEPYFEDGPVAQLVRDVVEDVVYVTAAGNYAQDHYEADYELMEYLGGNVHDFGSAAGQISDPTLNLSISPGQTVCPILQWNDPFSGSENDYDMFLLNEAETDLICPDCSSEDPQTGTENPSESFCYTNSGFTVVTAKLVVEKFSGADRRIEMIIRDRVMDQYVTAEGSIFGHQAAPGVVSVAAIDANDPGNDDIESFSSRGPSRIEYPSLEIRETPSLTGIDGISITGAGGFTSPFFGTSAAAPHIAGVAALLKQAAPNADPQTIIAALKSSAVDLGEVGEDRTFGAGRVDALAAVKQFDTDDDDVLDVFDNCLIVINADQLNTDGDSQGDACDEDDDNDGVADNKDAFPLDPAESVDTDGDGIGNNTDSDDDDDGLLDIDELQVYGTNPSRRDTDGDGLGDGEEIENGLDPLDPNDCPVELCPPRSSLIKLIPLLIDAEANKTNQQ
jgi:subtilisin family serine protease